MLRWGRPWPGLGPSAWLSEHCCFLAAPIEEGGTGRTRHVASGGALGGLGTHSIPRTREGEVRYPCDVRTVPRGSVQGIVIMDAIHHPVGPSAGPQPQHGASPAPCLTPGSSRRRYCPWPERHGEPQTWLLWFSVMILFTMTCSYPKASFTPESPPLAKATLPPAWLQGPKGAGHGLQWTVPQPEPILRTDTDAELSLPQ